MNVSLSAIPMEMNEVDMVNSPNMIPSTRNGYPRASFSPMIAPSDTLLPEIPSTTYAKMMYTTMGISDPQMIAVFSKFFWFFSSIFISGIAAVPNNANMMTPNGKKSCSISMVERLAGFTEE